MQGEIGRRRSRCPHPAGMPAISRCCTAQVHQFPPPTPPTMLSHCARRGSGGEGRRDAALRHPSPGRFATTLSRKGRGLATLRVLGNAKTLCDDHRGHSSLLSVASQSSSQRSWANRRRRWWKAARSARCMGLGHKVREIGMDFALVVRGGPHLGGQCGGEPREQCVVGRHVEFGPSRDRLAGQRGPAIGDRCAATRAARRRSRQAPQRRHAGARRMSVPRPAMFVAMVTAALAGLGDDLRLVRILLAVQQAEGDARAMELRGQALAVVDGPRADEHGPAAGLQRLDGGRHRPPLRHRVAEQRVASTVSPAGPLQGNHDHRQAMVEPESPAGCRPPCQSCRTATGKGGSGAAARFAAVPCSGVGGNPSLTSRAWCMPVAARCGPRRCGPCTRPPFGLCRRGRRNPRRAGGGGRPQGPVARRRATAAAAPAGQPRGNRLPLLPAALGEFDATGRLVQQKILRPGRVAG